MVSNKGFNEQFITMNVGTIANGTVVKVSNNNTCGKCDAGDKFLGVLVNSRNGIGSVQVCGVVSVPYTGTTAPALGMVGVSADGSGGIKADTTGRQVTVISLDTTNSIAEIIL